MVDAHTEVCTQPPGDGRGSGDVGKNWNQSANQNMSAKLEFTSYIKDNIPSSLSESVIVLIMYCIFWAVLPTMKHSIHKNIKIEQEIQDVVTIFLLILLLFCHRLVCTI